MRTIIRTRTLRSGEYAAVVLDIDSNGVVEWVGVFYWRHFGEFLKDATAGEWTRATVSVAVDTIAKALAELDF